MPRRVDGVRLGGESLVSRPGWSWPSTSLSWYGSTLMTLTSGCFAAIGLTRSRVGPHCDDTQNFGVANTSTNGSCLASASLTVVS